MVQLCKTVVKYARTATLGRPSILLRLHPQSDSQRLNCLKSFSAGAAPLYRSQKGLRSQACTRAEAGIPAIDACSLRPMGFHVLKSAEFTKLSCAVRPAG